MEAAVAVSLRAVSITTTDANAYVAAFHRHNGPAQMARFAVAAIDDETGEVHGVAIAGLPIARMAALPGVLEIRRVCTDGERNCCSFLYGCCIRAAKALGYWRLLTYTIDAEDGASLKASGWKLHGHVQPVLSATGGWASRPQIRPPNQHYLGPKKRWEIVFGTPPPRIVWPTAVQPEQLALFDTADMPTLFDVDVAMVGA